MVTGEVIVKKPFNYKRLFLSLLGIGLFLGVVYLVFLLGAIFSPYSGPIDFNYENPVVSLIEELKLEGVVINEGEDISETVQEKIIERAELEFDKDYINYVLYAMSAYELHNPPLSDSKPKIRVLVDEENYYSIVEEGNVSTFLEEVENPDMGIKISKREVIEAMLVEDMTLFMKESVFNGRTEIELIANKFTLASKGYLQMYNDITGEDLDDL